MTNHETSLVARLCKAENPRFLEDWADRDGYYVAACRVSAEDVPGLIDIVWKWDDEDWPNAETADVDPDLDSDLAQLLPVTAWRVLADLKADAAVEPLVEMLSKEEEVDDWMSDDLPQVFGRIGESAIPALTRLANDPQADFPARSIAACGLRYVAEYYPHTRQRIVNCLTDMLADAEEGNFDFNSTLLDELVELQAVESAATIERSFADNLVDVGVLGDWENVRRRLGVKGMGLKMPENPYNSIDTLCSQMGIGIFSDVPVFTFNEIDPDSLEAYFQRAHDTFSASSEARQVVDRYGRLGWFRSLLDFGANQLGEIVDVMTPDSVSMFLFDYAPRNVSVIPDAAAEMIFELTMFWEYLDGVYELPEAKSIVEWLKSDGLEDDLRAELSDSSNFGMAKSFVMLGQDAGYDMTSEEGLAEFMAAYNRSLLGENAPSALPREFGNQRVGRNDPCPCGSGKKFKKCCLR